MTEVQFIVGCLIGIGVGVTLALNGIALTNPETRLTFLSCLFGFAGVFGIICALMNAG
jgi:hypothetical protein